MPQRKQYSAQTISLLSEFILAKKGTLATIWIAAHLERKLRRSQIAETNISDSVDIILYPEVPIALRLSGHLLLGVVRIYSRKVNLLFYDCNEALSKIHQTFQRTTVNLPPGAVIAPYHSITLPESFDLDKLEPSLTRENSYETQNHVSSRDLITLKDQQDDQQPLFSLDERFEDYGNPYALMDVPMEDISPQDQHGKDDETHLNVEESIQLNVLPMQMEDDSIIFEGIEHHVEHQTSDTTHCLEKGCLKDHTRLNVEEPIPLDVLPPMSTEDDCMDFEGIGKGIENEISDMNNNNICARETLDNLPSFPDITVADLVVEKSQTTIEVPEIEKLRAVREVDQRPGQHLALEESDTERGSSDTNDQHESVENTDDAECMQKIQESPLVSEEPVLSQVEMHTPSSSAAEINDNDILGRILRNRTPKMNVAPSPVSVKRSGRKRKHPFDEITTLTSSFMRKQLKSTHDICRGRRKGPCTEYEIWMAERVEYHEKKLFLPATPGLCEVMKDIFTDVINLRFAEEVNSPVLQRKRKVGRTLVFDTPERVNHRESCTEGKDIDRAGSEAVNFAMVENREEEQDSSIPNRAASEPAEIARTSQVVEDTSKSLHEQILHEEPSAYVLEESQTLNEQASADVQMRREEPQIQCEEANIQIYIENPRANSQIKLEGSSTVAQTKREESSAAAQSQHEESSTVAQTQHDESSADVDNEIQDGAYPHKTIGPQQNTMSLADENGHMDAIGQDNSVFTAKSCTVSEESDVLQQSEGLEFLAESGDTDIIVIRTVTDPKVDPSNFDYKSGWSTRTRAVATYLKTKFESMDVSKNSSKQDQHIKLEDLVTGRTRREAARMFFETLVLETKGYLQVGQESSFGDIHLKPSRRLMKVVF